MVFGTSCLLLKSNASGSFEEKARLFIHPSDNWDKAKEFRLNNSLNNYTDKEHIALRFDFIHEGFIIYIEVSEDARGPVIVAISVREYQKNILNLGFSRITHRVPGEVLFDKHKTVRQSYLLSKDFLLIITEDYLELIHLRPHIERFEDKY